MSLVPQNTETDSTSASTYKVTVDSPMLSGNADVALDMDCIIIDSLFDRVRLSYADINAFYMRDYCVHAETDNGNIRFSGLGEKCAWLYNELCAAFNKTISKALFVEGDPTFDTNGDFSFTENGTVHRGRANIRVYKDCVLVLPANTEARRIPLLFVNGMNNADYTITLKLKTDECYSFSKLGYDTSSFVRHIEDNIRALRDKSTDYAKELDNSLTSAQAASAGGLLIGAIATDIKLLKARLPEFSEFVERKLRESRIHQYYKLLSEIGDTDLMRVGIRPIPVLSEDATTILPGISLENMTQVIQKLMNRSTETEGNEAELEEKPPEPMLWIIIPSKDKSRIILEMALPDDEASATYIFDTNGDFAKVSELISRVLEATNFQREFITLTDDKLVKNESRRILVSRTPAIAELRSYFIGRVIHASETSWKRGILKYMQSANNDGSITEDTAVENTSNVGFCTNCGAPKNASAKFCGTCGSKF